MPLLGEIRARSRGPPARRILGLNNDKKMRYAFIHVYIHVCNSTSYLLGKFQFRRPFTGKMCGSRINYLPWLVSGTLP